MGKETFEGEYGSKFRRSRHRTSEADRVVEGLNAVPTVDLLSLELADSAESKPVNIGETGLVLDPEEQAGLGQYLKLGGAVVSHAAELRAA